MNTTIHTFFTLLIIFSDLIEFTFWLGMLTRKYILPALIYTIVYAIHLYDELTTIQLELQPQLAL